MDITKVIIFSDMDGTLLTHDKKINEKDLNAIRKFRSLGGKFTFATGRTLQSFEQYREKLGTDFPLIMYNGAMIHDYGSGENLCMRPLPDNAKQMALDIMSLMPECGGEVLTSRNTYVFSNTKYQQIHTRLCAITPVYENLADIPDGEWLKVLFSLAPDRVPVLEEIIDGLNLSGVEFVRSAEILLEMLPKGISKGTALEDYRKLDGMADYTFVAIGDFDNDIEMITSADIGVCPANAEESVKNISDIVLSRDCNSGAVAELIEYMIKKCKC